MIEVFDISAGHVVGVRVSGKIDKEEVEQVIALLQIAIDEHGHVNLIVELDGWEGFTAGVLWEDIKHGLPLVGKIDREAVVTESKLLEIWTLIGNTLWPGVEARSFKPADREDAIEWVSELSD